jgi:hypothetical protein
MRMASCRSRRCGQKLQAGWSFCPRCGKDVRPDEFRPTILNCGHRFEGPKLYCVVCGKGYGGAKSAAALQANLRFGRCLMLIGFLLIGASFGVWKVHSMGSGPGFQWINSWYDQPFKLPGVATLRGNDYPSWASVFGAAVFVLGFLGTAAAKLNRPKPVRARTQPRHAQPS